MIINIGYSNGYSDALRDMQTWFGNHRYIFKNDEKIVMAILNHICNYKYEFFREKECYEMEIYYPNDKKESIIVKRYEGKG